MTKYVLLRKGETVSSYEELFPSYSKIVQRHINMLITIMLVMVCFYYEDIKTVISSFHKCLNSVYF